ncbi:MAG TPA: hypothetical protein VJQ82_25490 [Terriglobales bacterium]|nr:hypothetical protein [Terriglobales bacterium]
MAVVLCPTELLAGAWTSDAGHGQIIVTGSFFQTTRSFDKGGTTRPFENHGRFRQTALESYLEYGLSKRATVVLKVPAAFLDYCTDDGPLHSSGLGDVEIGGRGRFNSLESPWALSGQFTVAVPAYSAQRNPAPGNHQEDVEARFLLGRSLNRIHHHAFWDAEAAYRYRSGAPADQLRADFTAGIDLTRRLLLLGQSFLIFGLRNGAPVSAITNPNAQSDFDLYKGQVSLVMRLGRGTRLQAGWNDAFAGRNTGQGSTAMLAIWKTF